MSVRQIRRPRRGDVYDPADSASQHGYGSLSGHPCNAADGAAFRQRVRRLLLGSTTAQVLRRAPCPVLLVPVPAGPTDLVAWYEGAITRELSEHASGLSIFTPEEVASRFPPPHRARCHKEVTAATKALQQLAGKGVLICQQVKGTWQCFND